MNISKKCRNLNFVTKPDLAKSNEDPISKLIFIIDKSKNVNSNGKMKTEFSTMNNKILDLVYLINELFETESIKKDKRSETKVNDNSVHFSEIFGKLLIELTEFLVKSNDKELCDKIFEMIYLNLEKHSVRIKSSVILHDIIVKWVKMNDRLDDSNRPNYLRCMASFIFGNIPIIEKDLFSSIGLFFYKETEKYLNHTEFTNENLECLKYCISGIANLCYIPDNWNFDKQNDFLAKRFQICGKYINVFVDCLEKSLEKFKDISQISLFRLQHQCLHGLNYICFRPHGLSLENSTKLLKVLRGFCGFGLFKIFREFETGISGTDHEEDNSFSQILFESTDETTCSDFNVNYSRSMTKWEQKSRKLALELLLKVLSKTSKKMSTEMWSQYMPVSNYGSRRFNLLNLLEKEKDNYMKQLIISVIQEFIDNCKEFLSTAQYQSNSSAYLSLSHIVATVVFDIHKRLIHFILKHIPINLKLFGLRCLALLIESVCYNRLQSGLITLVVFNLRQIFLESQSEHNALRCAILHCLTNLINKDSINDEMRTILIRAPKSSNDVFNSNVIVGKSLHHQTEINKPSWLVQLCLKFAHTSLVNELWSTGLSSESWNSEIDILISKLIDENHSEHEISLRCQSLVTLGAILSKYDSVIRPSLDILKKTLLACLDETINDNNTLTSNPIASNSNMNSYSEQPNSIELKAQVLRVFAGFLNTLDNKKERRFIGVLSNTEKIDDEDEINGGAGDIWKVSLASSSSAISNNQLMDIRRHNIDIARDWWQVFLDRVLLCLQSYNSEKVRWSAAQCLSLVSDCVLETFIVQEKNAFYRLLEMFADDSVGVACQAVWALGYWVVMRPLNECTHPQLIDDLMLQCYEIINREVIVQHNTTRYSVAANCVWAIGNICEVLVAHREALLTTTSACNPQFVTEWLHDVPRLCRLMRMLSKCCCGNNFASSHIAAFSRLQENSVRTLGLLCRLIDSSLLDDNSSNHELMEVLAQTSDTFCLAFALPDKAGKVKVKWNACLCVSHLLRNSIMIDAPALHYIKLEVLIQSLTHTIAQDRYFKVRNNAIFSLLTYFNKLTSSSIITQPIHQSICLSIFPILIKSCISVAQKTSAVPFSEIHRHCLCLYMLNIAILRLICLLDVTELSAEIFYLLREIMHDHIPLAWQHIIHLNRSFNKSALLPNTLMIQSPITATYKELDDIADKINSMLITKSSTSTEFYKSVIAALHQSRPHELISNELEKNSQHGSFNKLTFSCNDTNKSDDDDDDGLLSKKPGANLIFSQIYD